MTLVTCPSDSNSILSLKRFTKQRCDGDGNAGLEMLVLKINGDLRDGQDEEGGDVGGHQLIHRVPFQPELGCNKNFLMV